MVITAVSAVTSSTSISSPKVKSSIQSMTFCWLLGEVMRPANGRGDRDMVSKSTTLPLLVVSTVDNPEPAAISSTSFVERRSIRSQGVLAGHSENAGGRSMCEDGAFSGGTEGSLGSG